jgi:hypothetical protein
VRVSSHLNAPQRQGDAVPAATSLKPTDFSMTSAQYDELMTTVKRMRDTADALSRTCQMLAASETSAARHGYFHRLHIALNDCAISLRHAIDAAPAMVHQ